ncbi:hypothetical protein L0668_17415 [Paraglaciecola aquimarina]|uniref:Uncharacterized protein n=1 Tax=Paraglaciecola algarum TaxID=3050085 RepID=A0ABS9DAB9_9ALTE|nr:hypothetical protein [Paraglaciecola sp. G1-23]MCF2949902.1 hypothetical protein [Paraglaciecola sp. G1-23]
MLSTLIYMTFVPSYYLSASLNNSAVSLPDKQDDFYLVLNDNLFQKEIESLNLKKVDLALSLTSTEKEMVEIDKLALQDKRKELLVKLTQRLTIHQVNDTLQFKLHVIKHNIWKQILRSALLKNKDLNKVFDGQKIEPLISWATDYRRVSLVFVLTMLLSFALAIILLSFKEKQGA